MAQYSLRTGYRLVLLTAVASAQILLEGCGGSASSFFYVNKNTQAIRRDTITAAGVTTFVQNPQDAVHGTIKLAPVEVIALQPVSLPVDAAKSPFDEPRTLMVPPGFTVSLHATGLGRPRDLALREDGTLFVSNFDGQILAIGPDGTRSTVVQGLRSPHGLDLHNGSLIYTDETRIFQLDFTSPTAVTGKSTLLSDKLPPGSVHYTRSIRWVPNDKKYYVAVGSTSNKGIEDNNAYATVLRMAEKGGQLDAAARGGLRDVVAMDVHPETGELWMIDNGTGLLSAELATTEINILKVGRHYGWPFFYSQNFPDPDYMTEEAKNLPRYPTSPVGPVIELQAHVDALGMRFHPGGAAGPEWRNAMIIAYNGTPKVVRVKANPDGSDARQSDIVTGFLDADGKAWGRPVGVAISRDGSTMYISDDRAGAIYRISKQ